MAKGKFPKTSKTFLAFDKEPTREQLRELTVVLKSTAKFEK